MDTGQEAARDVLQRSRSRVPLCWLVLMAFDLSLMALTMAQDPERHSGLPPEQTVETEISGPGDVAADAVRFEALDVFLNSGEQPLAAWQVALMSRTSGVEIVDVEGGEHPAFKDPPYYDSRAMKSNRVILAAFNTGSNLPTGRSRVARVHVQVRGPGDRVWRSELTTTANAEGTKIPAEVSIEKAL